MPSGTQRVPRTPSRPREESAVRPLHILYNAIKLLHELLPRTNPSRSQATNPANHDTEQHAQRPGAPINKHLLQHYAHNPHFRRTYELTKRDLNKGAARTVRHTPAHKGNDAAIRSLLDANAVWTIATKSYVVPKNIVAQIEHLVSQPGAQSMRSRAEVTAATQNALADWGARQVAVYDKEASTHLTGNTFSAKRWTLTTPDGALLQTDDATIRREVTARVGRQIKQTLTGTRPSSTDEIPSSLNKNHLWAAASTHVLKRHRDTNSNATDGHPQQGKKQRQPPDHLTKHYCQTTLVHTTASSTTKKPSTNGQH